ncbi:FG-GAP-like repeat-containing protein [Streptomyces sp. LP05-1]|uniref:FG-GAP-like repeat-containing protein n=1 Tax=Streptomyces pyxinae TaxID=2970734 RepID=A0ABT2CHU1_9ACTN|nr:FG-GAP-like repeat-containing protein [Streptomyces sp. LP05-1]MCS0636982.1 FG-GAP-like repeat-containing protein [Streptomyces sp. LP05-1]
MTVHSTGSTHRLRRQGVVAALLVLVAGLLVVLRPQQAAAEDRPISSTPLMTWNMRGANEVGRDTNKWQNYVRTYARQASVVLLQEAGAAPADMADRQADLTRTTVDRNNNVHTHTIRHYRWNVGSSSRDSARHVYFALTQNGVGGRVNLAVVVSGDPDEVNVVENPVGNGRLALGVRYGSNWYFTVHGLSGGGGDSAVLLDAIDTQVDQWAADRHVSYHWTAGGDFNVDPDELSGRDHFPPAMTVSTDVNTPTHDSGNRYDYFVTDDIAAAQELQGAWVYAGPPSDHRPTALGEMRAAAGQPPSALRYMPEGDSITQGLGSSNDSGARDEIQADFGKMTVGQLYGNNILSPIYDLPAKRDLVGERKNGRGIPDPDHEGWPGYTIDQIAEEASDAVPSMKPNVVGLLAGTNDMVRNVDVGNAPARLSRLIDQTFQGSPGVAIVVGTLTPSTNPAIQQRIDAYNASITTMLDQRIANGDHLVRVDLSAVTTADLADEVHPTDAGYRKIADAYVGGVRTALADGWISDPVGTPGAEPGNYGGYDPQGRVWEGLPGDPDAAGAMKYADLDGDNRDDIVWLSPTGAATAWLNRDDHGRIAWTYRGEIAMGTGQGPDRVFFADLDKDGLDDYIVIRPDKVIDAYYNRGGDTVGPDGWRPGWEPHPNYGRGTDTPVDRIRFADIDGDGRADYVRLLDFDTKVDVFYNRGGDSPGHDGWQPGGALLTDLTSTTNKQIEFADLNADGKADYIALDSDGVPYARLNTGRADWFPRGKIAKGTGGTIALPELDGDGRADWVKIARNGAIDAWINKGGDPPR